MVSDLALRFLVAALATWRVTSLLVAEDGPGRIFARWKTRLGPTGFWSELFDCMWCLSVWIGLLTTVVALTPAWWLLWPLALSAVAIGIGRWLGQA